MNKSEFVDAPADLRFRVSRESIDGGVPGNATACIFAKAIAESVKGITYAEVRPNFARVVFEDGKHYVYQVPRELRLGLKALDAFGARIVEPGAYTLLKPVGVRRIDYRRKARAAHKRRVAEGAAKTYKPRTTTERTVIRLSGVRSSIWGAVPEVRLTFDSRPSIFERVESGRVRA